MVITVSNSIKHSAQCQKSVNNDQELQEKVLDGLTSLGVSREETRWNENGQLELTKRINDLKLHSLMLKMESLGLDLKMTKQTLIEIC